MVSRIYVDDLPALVRAGRIPLAVVNEAVRRVLRAKATLGYLTIPSTGATPERERSVLLAPEPPAAGAARGRRVDCPAQNDGQLLPVGSRVPPSP